MASDEIVWQTIDKQFCAFKLKTSKAQTFCRNEHNVTGFCNRQSCPLANSKYATVRRNEADQHLYLFIKSPEHNHLPSKWWQRIRLPSNYAKALEMLDEKLIYWPKFLVHKSKQRLTRLHQVAIRSRRLAREEERLGEKLVPRLAPKIRRREETRERKAESAAKVERAIERELIERLKSGAYGDRPINVEEGVWKKVLRGLERAEKGEEVELEEEEERELEEEDEEGVGEVEYVSDIDEEEDEEEMEDFEDWLGGESADEEDDSNDDDDEDDASESSVTSDGEATGKSATGAKRKRPAAPPPKARKKPARVEIEYETEPAPRELVTARA